MTADNMRTAIHQELRHGETALQAARLLRQSTLLNDSLNRLYYAMYHAVTALLLTVGVEPRRHRALPGLLGVHFSHALGAADLAVVARAATWRDLADYERTWHATPEIVDQAHAEIEPLIERVRSLLATGGWIGEG